MTDAPKPRRDPGPGSAARPPADDPRTDALLIASINAGRHEDFEILYRRHGAWVYRLALRFTGDADAAADVLQDTFVYLLRRLPSLRLHARLTTFLYPAVRNLAITASRRRGRSPAPLDPDGPTLTGQERADPNPVGPEITEGRAALAAAVAALPDGQREVLLMRIVEEMSVSDIATALDIPAGTAKSRLHHALAALRDDPRTRVYFGS